MYTASLLTSLIVAEPVRSIQDNLWHKRQVICGYLTRAARFELSLKGRTAREDIVMYL